jgi:peptidyl-prolyl cis-trans isomerase B (cyclophilin B)
MKSLRHGLLFLGTLGLVILPLATCSSKPKSSASETKKETQVEENSQSLSAPTQDDVKNIIKPGKKYIVTIVTDKGKIVGELNPADAPLTSANFIKLARSGFYNGLTFHRVVPNFVIQGGDPQGTGSGGPGYTVPAEIKGKHIKGAWATARLGDQVNPNKESSGSQFYITLEATPFLDGGYTVFGTTLEGEDVVAKIAVGDKMNTVTIEEK